MMNAFPNQLITWLFLCLPIAASAQVQDQYRIFAPMKDVAMLVDVSVSVQGDKEGHEDSEKIIQDIVSGRGFSNKRLGKKWEVEASHEMATLFGAYLGQPSGGETAELRPLLAERGNFLAMRIGTVQTVLAGDDTHGWHALSTLQTWVLPVRCFRRGR